MIESNVILNEFDWLLRTITESLRNVIHMLAKFVDQ